MKTKIYLFVLICVFISLPSCEEENSELLSSTEEIAEIKSALIDSLETVLPLEETEELKAFKKRIEELAKTQLRSTSSLAMLDDYDENFSSNMYAIRELPLTFQARGQANTSNRYLSANGKGKEITLAATGNQKAQSFYIKVLPATSGIPYLIYSSQTDTPLSVGQNSSNPNRKVLFAQNDASGSLFSASWDLLSSASYKGYFAIQSQSYLGQSDPNNMWSVFNYVLEVQNDNKLGYAQYTKKAQQEFLLKPDATFTITDITFDEKRATVTEQQSLLKISVSDRNEAWDWGKKPITFKKTQNEESRFSEKNILVFNLNTNNLFARPTVEAGRLVMPRSTTPKDMRYLTTTQYIPKVISFTRTVDTPPRCLIEASAFIKNYIIDINYTVKGIHQDREIKFSGTWRGTVYLDPKIAEPIIATRYFDLDTGEEIIVDINTRSITRKSIK